VYLFVVYLGRKGTPAADPNPFVEATLRTAAPRTLAAMARNKALPLSDEQIKLGTQHPSQDVSNAFCSRERELCAR
jgi:hypothetical protein